MLNDSIQLFPFTVHKLPFSERSRLCLALRHGPFELSKLTLQPLNVLVQSSCLTLHTSNCPIQVSVAEFMELSLNRLNLLQNFVLILELTLNGLNPLQDFVLTLELSLNKLNPLQDFVLILELAVVPCFGMPKDFGILALMMPGTLPLQEERLNGASD